LVGQIRREWKGIENLDQISRTAEDDEAKKWAWREGDFADETADGYCDFTLHSTTEALGSPLPPWNIKLFFSPEIFGYLLAEHANSR
jgi:hypothetical protein